MVFAIAVQALALSGITQAPAPPSPERQLLALVNMERLHAHLIAFQWDAKVAEAARAHSMQLADHRTLSHQFAGEPELTHRISAAGVRFSAVAENVAAADDAEDAHLGLMNSPGHRANILNPSYNVVGIAVVRVDKQIYVTEDFAHEVPVFSVEQFREGVIASFNQLRRSHRMAPIESHPDAALDQQACNDHSDLGTVLQGTSHPTRATMFNAAEPSQLPPAIDQAAADIALRRMSIGVCFRSDKTRAIPDFSVILAFYQFK